MESFLEESVSLLFAPPRPWPLPLPPRPLPRPRPRPRPLLPPRHLPPPLAPLQMLRRSLMAFSLRGFGHSGTV